MGDNRHMKVTRKSPLSGVIMQMDLDVTREQLISWEKGELVQDAMPHLTPDERQFIISGISPYEWRFKFGDRSDEEEQG